MGKTTAFWTTKTPPPTGPRHAHLLGEGDPLVGLVDVRRSLAAQVPLHRAAVGGLVLDERLLGRSRRRQDQAPPGDGFRLVEHRVGVFRDWARGPAAVVIGGVPARGRGGPGGAQSQGPVVREGGAEVVQVFCHPAGRDALTRYFRHGVDSLLFFIVPVFPLETQTYRLLGLCGQSHFYHDFDVYVKRSPN